MRHEPFATLDRKPVSILRPPANDRGRIEPPPAKSEAIYILIGAVAAALVGALIGYLQGAWGMFL